MSKEQLLTALDPLLAFIATLSPNEDARVALEEKFPVASDNMQALKKMVRTGVSEGWLCEREQGGIRFGRLLKHTDDQKLSIDTVSMDVPGPGHLHPNGEFDLCFSVSGEPTFDGRPEGWTVYGENSWHVPTVKNGKMDILYFLPEGKIVFGPKPS